MIINNPVPATQDVKVTSVPAPLDVSIADNADGQAPYGAAGLLAVLSRLQAFDGTDFNRLEADLTADGVVNGLRSLAVLSQLMGYNGASWDRVRSGTPDVDAYSSGSSLDVRNFNYGFNGTAWDRVRAANVYKWTQGIIPGAGNITIWTPAAGKKFRFMEYVIDVTGDASLTGGATVTFEFLDGGVGFAVNRQLWIPATATNQLGGYSMYGNLGNGYLSSAANNTLQINNNIAWSGGVLNVYVVGTEE